MADDEVDELYAVEPGEFTALRGRLAEVAKRRGDPAAAKRISRARKPTTAAWVVNTLIHTDREVTERLTGLGERLRAAHAAMDGERIRELSSEQRRLTEKLSRAAFDAAGVDDPSATLRDDVTGTLQAAIADPEIRSRLGRLTRAERWSGFGDFGETVLVTAPSASRAPRAAPANPPPPEPGELDTARAAVTDAERARSVTEAALTERRSELATARLAHDDAAERLTEAQRRLTAAQDAYDEATRANRDAADAVKAAKARLKTMTATRKNR